MISKIIGFLIVLACLTVSILRAMGIMEGDFIIPLILLSQMLILGYLVNVATLVAKDMIIRYNMDTRNTPPPPPSMHTWN